MKSYGYLLLFIIGGLLASCKQSPLVIYATTASDTRNVSPGSRVLFVIQAESSNSLIQRIHVYSYDIRYNEVSRLDTTFLSAQSEVTMNWIYDVPYYSDTTTSTLTFATWNVSGEEMRFDVPLRILPAGDAPLITTEGVIMYSAASGKKNAFSFLSRSVCFHDGDEPLYTFYDALPSDSLSEAISRSWKASRDDVWFARFNSLDFGNVTISKIQNAYDMCTKENSVTEIQDGDVILVGTRKEAYGVLRVSAVVDMPGRADDRYIFTTKTFLPE